MPRKVSKSSKQKSRKPKVEVQEATFEGKQEFLVKWVGYPNTENTWEPLENLDNCSFLVNEYLLSFGIEQLRNRALATEGPHNPRPTVHDTFSATTILETATGATNQYIGHTAGARSRLTSRSLSPASGRLGSAETVNSSSVHDWELRSFEGIFNESHGPRIVVENTVDSAGRPRSFKYINDSVYGDGVQPPNPDFIDSCSCGPGQCGSEDACSCMREAVLVNESGGLPYEEDGRVTEQANKLLWECNSKCGCGPGCTWNYSQRPRQLALRIKRFEGKGWGVVLDQHVPVPPRTFISRYVGEIITSEEAEHRGSLQANTGTTYLFDLDYNHEKQATYSIDACKLGNETHFINHSCDPNLSVYMLKSGGNGGDDNLMTLSFWSNRWIRHGDELTFDYNGKFVPHWHKDYNGDGSQSQGTVHPGEGTTPCHCGALNCRQWVHL
ncbi:hypothetical protein BGZ95_010367 [Linnemannia exigua]|uniref:Histone-lysine N-methyltransferase n=1 Tax=Linnemannia exigua TaxID=604196 RepID=A0AAD4DBE8_9FUNG|nr:hypothetical protein BGZ95_010367 [Linnemannia exigua]